MRTEIGRISTSWALRKSTGRSQAESTTIPMRMGPPGAMPRQRSNRIVALAAGRVKYAAASARRRLFDRGSAPVSGAAPVGSVDPGGIRTGQGPGFQRRLGTQVAVAQFGLARAHR